MLRLFTPDHDRALNDAQTWYDNPFVQRDARRDRKRRQVTKTLAWMSLLLFLLCTPAVFGLETLIARYSRTPWFLGGDLFTSLLILISGIHIWYIAGAAQR